VARHRWLLYGGAAVGVGLAFAVSVLVTAGPGIFREWLSASQCRAAPAVAAAAAPFAQGDLAAFRPVDPRDVSALPFDGTGTAARTLGELGGRTVLLNLWATWCAPCRVEMPSLAALAEAREGDRFAVVATSIDNRDQNRPEDFLAETGATALAYHREPTLSLYNSLKAAGLATGMPTTLLIASDGCVAGVVNAPAAWDSADALALVDAAVAADGGAARGS
jgi:thiol-disulfide isomerase/thioredoxin